MAGINSITGAGLSTDVKWSASNNNTGQAFQPISNPGDVRKSVSLGTENANSAVGGADEVFAFQQAIAGAGSATFDLYNLTNVLGQSAVAIARIKGYQLRLLDATDDTTITTPVSTKAVVTNIGVALPAPLDFGNTGSGLTITLTTAAGAVTGVAIGVAGSGYPPSTSFLVVPVQAGGSGCTVGVITNGSGVPTTLVLIGAGTGYSNGTVPSVVAGQFPLLTGSAHLYTDKDAGGVCLLSATSRNIKVYNMHATNTATVELCAFGGTT